jgi:TolB-like protein/DNA-binding winged helix-turn-helix (wHTH) protein
MQSGLSDSAQTRVYRFDGWLLRTWPRELFRDGRRVPMQDQPLQILEELASKPNQLVTREQLIARLWPRGVVDFDGSLNTAVRKLRAALGDDSEAPRYIETVPRQGYRFVGQVDRDPVAEPARLERAAESPEAHDTKSTGVVATAHRARTRRFPAFFTGALLIVVAAFAAVFGPNALREGAETDRPVGRYRIAVLPFENLSPDPANEFFTDGLHEEVLSSLTNRTENLDVISRTTMTLYRAAPLSAAAIAAELGATHVLEGSVRREGQDVRLTLQLIDARNDVSLWSQTYDRRLSSAMTLQSQVATEVAAQLAVELSADNARLPPSPNAEAYDLYLKAKLAAQGFAGRVALHNIVEVEAWLDRAIELDPSFAAAYAERSRIYLMKFDSSYDLTEDNLSATRADLETVRKLVGDVPLVLTTQSHYALVVDRDLDKAVELIETPQVLASKDVAVLMGRAGVLAAARRLDESLAVYQQAARLDPRNVGLFQAWHAILWIARRPAEALEVLHIFGEELGGHVAFVFSFTGRTDQLDERVNPVRDSIDDGIRLMARVSRLRLQGRIRESIDVIETSGVETIRHDSVSPLMIPAVGRKPVAELHGWAMLLTGDALAAAHDGRVLLDFVAHEPATKHNAWFLRFLAAEGELFSGRGPQAISEMRAALALTPRHLDIAIDRYAQATAALILAWAGAGDEAVELLTLLSTEFPGLGPADIAREPLFSAPLASNARYAALAGRLEAEIVANRKLFDAASVSEQRSQRRRN